MAVRHLTRLVCRQFGPTPATASASPTRVYPRSRPTAPSMRGGKFGAQGHTRRMAEPAQPGGKAPSTRSSHQRPGSSTIGISRRYRLKTGDRAIAKAGNPTSSPDRHSHRPRHRGDLSRQDCDAGGVTCLSIHLRRADRRGALFRRHQRMLGWQRPVASLREHRRDDLQPGPLSICAMLQAAEAFDESRSTPKATRRSR